MARLMIRIEHEEIQRDLPYQIIAETMSRGIWETGCRKRLYSATFTDAEKRKIPEIGMRAKRWALVSGVPDKGVLMSVETYKLWHKLAAFCCEL